MTNNLILLGLLILSLVWKNVSDNKRADKNENKFEELVGASAVYEKKEEYMLKKAKQDTKQFEETIAKYELEITSLKQTINDLDSKLRMKEKK